MRSLWLLLLASLPAAANEVFAPSDIPLLDNRHIDYGVKGDHLHHQHKPGTPSVIWCDPWQQTLCGQGQTAPTWASCPSGSGSPSPSATPCPALGRRSGRWTDNRVRLLTNIQVESEPLPARLYQGERVKLQSRLLIDGAAPGAGYYLTDLH